MIEEEDEAALKSVLFHVSIDVLPLFYVQLNSVSFSHSLLWAVCF